MTTIYALREVGATEARYIGRSDKPLGERLLKHIQNAKRNYPRAISGWIKGAGEVEIVPLAQCPRQDAAAEERRMVALYHSAGHRLTNSHLLPRAEGLSL